MSDNGSRYRLEYAQSNRAKCHGPKPCHGNTINQGVLRLGTLAEGGFFRWWMHWGCLTPQDIEELKEKFKSASELDGYQDLEEADKAKVSKAWVDGRVAPEDIPEIAKPDSAQRTATQIPDEQQHTSSSERIPSSIVPHPPIDDDHMQRIIKYAHISQLEQNVAFIRYKKQNEKILRELENTIRKHQQLKQHYEIVNSKTYKDLEQQHVALLAKFEESQRLNQQMLARLNSLQKKIDSIDEKFERVNTPTAPTLESYLYPFPLPTPAAPPNADKLFWEEQSFKGDRSSLAYLVRADGEVFPDAKREKILEALRGLLSDSAIQAGWHARTWEKCGDKMKDLFVFGVERKYPEFALCANHWKAYQIARDYYKEWRQSFFRPASDEVTTTTEAEKGIGHSGDDNDEGSSIFSSTSLNGRTKRKETTPTETEPAFKRPKRVRAI